MAVPALPGTHMLRKRMPSELTQSALGSGPAGAGVGGGVDVGSGAGAMVFQGYTCVVVCCGAMGWDGIDSEKAGAPGPATCGGSVPWIAAKMQKPRNSAPAPIRNPFLSPAWRGTTTRGGGGGGGGGAEAGGAA